MTGGDRARDPEDGAARDPDGNGTPEDRTWAGEGGAEGGSLDRDAGGPAEEDVNPTGEKDPGDNPPLPREWN